VIVVNTTRKKIRIMSLILIFIIYSISEIQANLLLDDSETNDKLIIVDINGGGDYESILEGYHYAREGYTIQVQPGLYHENLVIRKSIKLIGSGSENTIIKGDGNRRTIYIQSTIDVEISGFGIENIVFDDYYIGYGIYIHESDYVKIENISAKNYHRGIYTDSDYNSFINNNLSNNEYGIYLADSDSNTIKNNNFNSNTQSGIYLSSSRYTIIKNNCMINCGIEISGDLHSEWDSHIIDNSNTYNQLPILYLQNSINHDIRNPAGQVIIANCGNITINNINDGSSVGILVGFSNEITITNNNCSQRKLSGISLKYSNNNFIENNTCILNIESGIKLLNSNNNFIKNNTCGNNALNGIDVSVHSSGTSSYQNSIINNICNKNKGIGIAINGNSNNIQNNTCNGNYYGISTNRENNLVVNNYCNLNTEGILDYGGYSLYLNNSLQSNSNTAITSYGYKSTIINNTMYMSGLSLDYFGFPEFSYYIIENNTVNNKPIIFWLNKSNCTVPEGAGQIFLGSCSNITVSNQNCSDASTGINIDNSDNISITNNICNGNSETGIKIRFSDYNQIENNICNDQGIQIMVSNSNSFINNTCAGIQMYPSQKNTFRNNSLISSGFHFYIWNPLYWYPPEIGIDNTLNGKPILYLEDMVGESLPPNIGQIILRNCSDIQIIDQNCSKGSLGIVIISSENILIQNNSCSNNQYGIYIESSKNISIINNKCNANLYGIWIQNSEYISIHNNSCNFNEDRGISIFYSNSIEINGNKCNYNLDFGIYIRHSDSNLIINNTINFNEDNGLKLSGADQNLIKSNNCTGNLVGIVFVGAEKNVVIENTVSFNSRLGFEVGYDRNYIYHNNIISNNVQAIYSDIKYWSYYGEGNYWSDYTGVDDDINATIGQTGDYIGDTEVPHQKIDSFPYTVPDGWKLPKPEYIKDSNKNDTSKGFDMDEIFGEDKEPDDGIPWWWILIVIIIILFLILISRVRSRKKEIKEVETKKRKLKRIKKMSKSESSET
jgi:parallel beta-helix repeat protein